MSTTIVYKGFNLIDGTGKEPVKDSYMMVEGEKIIKIGKVSDLSENSNFKTIDLSGKFVMPGLINSHVHITMEPVGNSFAIIDSESDAMTSLRGVKNLKKTLELGTTYFRDLGGPVGIDLDLRNAVNKKFIEGPEFLAAGKVICMTGGHGWMTGREADGPVETRKAAREQLKAGADVIKVMATGGVMTEGVEPGSPQFTIEEMASAIEEAHKAGKKTATHAQGTTGIKNAIKAGIDSIEHGFYLDDEIFEMMKEKGVFLVATLVAPYFIVENGKDGTIPEYAVKKATDAMEAHQESFKKAYKAGVKIAMGTDSGTPYNHHGSAPHEIKLMIECGMNPMDALVASTKGSAECLGITDKYGTIEKNKFADFLVLDSNPLDNIDTLFNINSVYKLGKKVK
jgi:imidazolonepropionase-like amidohydrolase